MTNEFRVQTANEGGNKEKGFLENGFAKRRKDDVIKNILKKAKSEYCQIGKFFEFVVC